MKTIQTSFSFLILVLFLISTTLLERVAKASEPKLSLIIQLPTPGCKEESITVPLEATLKKSCNLLGESLLINKGPWGFGIFDEFSCSQDAGKLPKADNTWILNIDAQRFFVTFTMSPSSQNREKRGEKSESTARFMMSRHSLRFLADSKFMRFVAAELLDQLPFQGRLVKKEKTNSSAAENMFPKPEKAMGSINSHSPSSQWTLSSLAYETSTGLWRVKEPGDSIDGTSSYQNTMWWINKSGRKLRSKEIRQNRDDLYFKMLDTYDSDFKALAKNEQVTSQKVLSCLLPELAFDSAMSPSEQLVLPQQQIPYRLQQQTAGNSSHEIAIPTLISFGVLGGGMSKISVLGANSQATQTAFARLDISGSMLPNLSLEGGNLKTKYSFKNSDILPTQDLNDLTLNQVSVDYQKTWFSLGINLNQIPDPFAILFTAQWSYMQRSYSLSNNSAILGFKNDTRNLWSIGRIGIGLEISEGAFTSRAMFKYSLNISDAEQLQAYSGQIELNYDIAKYSDLLQSLVTEMRFIYFAGIDYDKIVQHAASTEDFDARLNLNIPIPTTGIGILFAW